MWPWSFRNLGGFRSCKSLPVLLFLSDPIAQLASSSIGLFGCLLHGNIFYVGKFIAKESVFCGAKQSCFVIVIWEIFCFCINNGLIRNHFFLSTPQLVWSKLVTPPTPPPTHTFTHPRTHSHRHTHPGFFWLVDLFSLEYNLTLWLAYCITVFVNRQKKIAISNENIPALRTLQVWLHKSSWHTSILTEKKSLYLVRGLWLQPNFPLLFSTLFYDVKLV